MLPFDMQGIYGFLLLCYSNFVSKTRGSQIFDFEKCCDREIGVRGHSRSSKPTRINPPPDILETFEATIGLSRTVSEIEGDSVENRKIFSPLYI